jgi:hypothetical protein
MKLLRNLVLVLLLVLATASIALRWYFNDQKLRQIAEQQLSKLAQAPVHIAALHLGLWDGIEVDGLQVTSGRETLRIKRLALHWTWAFKRQITLSEVAIEGIDVTIDKQGKLARFSKTSSGDTPPFDAQQFVMPIAVEVRKISLIVEKITWLDNKNSASLTDAYLTGKFSGKDKLINLDMVLGIGDPQHFATATIDHDKTHLVMQPYLTTRIHSTKLTCLHLSLESKIHLNNRPLLAINAAVSDVFADRRVELQKLEVALHFDDVAPLIAVFLPQMHLHGRLNAVLTPFSAPIENIPQQLFGLHVQTEAFGVQMPGVQLRNIQTVCDLEVAQSGHVDIKNLSIDIDRKLFLQAHGLIDRAQTSILRFRHLKLNVDIPSIAALRTMLSMQLPANGTLSASANLNGDVSYQELAQLLQPPKGADLSQQLDNATQLMETVLQRLRRGLPFTAHLEVTGSHLAYTDMQTQVHNMRTRARFAIEQHRLDANIQTDIEKITGPMYLANLRNNAHWTTTSDGFDFSFDNVTGEAKLPNTVLQNSRFQTLAHYIPGGDLQIQRLQAEVPSAGFSLDATGSVHKPLRALATRAWKKPGLPGIETSLALRMTADLNKAPLDMAVQGTAQCEAHVLLRDALAKLTGTLQLDDVSVQNHDNAIYHLRGTLPFELGFLFGQSPQNAAVLTKDLALGDGSLSLATYEQDIRQHPTRSSFYETARPYQRPQHLTAESIHVGPYSINQIDIDGRLRQGVLTADRFSMQFLGGDVLGSFGLQLAPDGSVRAVVNGEVSNLDASHFERLHLTPGPGSELNADLHFAFLLGSNARDVDLNVNVTRLGTQTLDRLLQLLDPDQLDPKLQEKRKQLKLVTIARASAWIRYENLNIDLDTLPIWHIPYTKVGFPKLDKALIRRYALSDQLNIIMQPYQNKLAMFLGW